MSKPICTIANDMNSNLPNYAIAYFQSSTLANHTAALCKILGATYFAFCALPNVQIIHAMKLQTVQAHAIYTLITVQIICAMQLQIVQIQADLNTKL